MFTDPFGLKVRLIGEAVSQAVERLLAASPTFARMYSALDNQPASKVDYVIEQSTREGVLAFGGANDVFAGIGHTIAGVLGKGLSKVAEETLSPDVVAHEVIHAAASFWRATGQDETGVPAHCGDHNSWSSECSDIQDKIRQELEEYEKKER